MATHTSILTWRIPWTEESGELQSMGSQRVRHDLVIEQIQSQETGSMKHRLANLFIGCSGHQPVPARVFFILNDPVKNLYRVFLAAQGAQATSGFPVRQENRNHWLSLGPGGSKIRQLQQDAMKPRGLRCSWEGEGKILWTCPALGEDGNGAYGLPAVGSTGCASWNSPLEGKTFFAMLS